jgi:hypothetical protein
VKRVQQFGGVVGSFFHQLLGIGLKPGCVCMLLPSWPYTRSCLQLSCSICEQRRQLLQQARLMQLLLQACCYAERAAL